MADIAVVATSPAGVESSAVAGVSPNDVSRSSIGAGTSAIVGVTLNTTSTLINGVESSDVIPAVYIQQPSTMSASIGDLGQLQVAIQFQAIVTADLAVPELPEIRTLGCGVYDVWVMRRGGTAIRKLIDVSNIQFNRVLNDISTAQVVVGQGGGQSMSDSCCAAISDIEPWKHEVAIFRGNGGSTGPRDLVWVGPVRRIEIDAEAGEAVITARDLFSWLDRRFYRGEAAPNAGITAAGGDTVPDLDVDDTDLSYIWSQVITDALLPDNPGILVETPGVTNIPAARFVSRAQFRMAGDVLREIASSGIDYTVINRTIRAGASEIQTPAIGLLIDEHFAKPPRIIIDGDDMATRWVVGGAGTGQDGPDEAGDTSLTLFVSPTQQVEAINPIDANYGLLEQYIFQPEIEDRPGDNGVSTAAGSGRPSYTYFSGADNTDASYSIYQAARTRWEMHHQPYTTIEGGELVATAPFDFNTLIPGSILRVALREGCRNVQGYYRLREVSVRADENRDTVDVQFENLGTTSLVVPSPTPSPSELPTVEVPTPPAFLRINQTPTTSPLINLGTGGTVWDIPNFNVLTSISNYYKTNKPTAITAGPFATDAGDYGGFEVCGAPWIVSINAAGDTSTFIEVLYGASWSGTSLVNPNGYFDVLAWVDTTGDFVQLAFTFGNFPTNPTNNIYQDVFLPYSMVGTNKTIQLQFNPSTNAAKLKLNGIIYDSVTAPSGVIFSNFVVDTAYCPADVFGAAFDYSVQVDNGVPIRDFQLIRGDMGPVA